MKTNKKSSSISLRQQLRDGLILYAAANSYYPVNKDLMLLYRQAINGEIN